MLTIDFGYRIKLIEKSWQLNINLLLQIMLKLKQKTIQKAKKN